MTKKIFLFSLTTLFLIATGCQNSTDTNTAANNSGTSNAVANTNASPAASVQPLINTREPQSYRATLVMTAQTDTGDKTVGVPEFSADVARNGSDHYLAFKLPNNEHLIYLDKGDKHYVIVPERKQYAQLTQAATGFQVQNLMTPGQLVTYLQRQLGYEKVGDEKFGDRMTEKYRYAAGTQTGTQAGEVKSEAYVYVDKETGLPLHSDIFLTASGNVQGAKGGRISTEMRNLTTQVDPSLFEIPPGMTEVQPDQVRQQIDALTGTVAAIFQSFASSMGTPSSVTTTVNTNTGSTTTTTTIASPSPSASTSK